MTTNVGSTGDEVFICRVEMPDVASLHDKHDDPVNAGDDDIEGERRPHVLVLTPYCLAVVTMFTVWGSIESVVDGSYNNQEP